MTSTSERLQPRLARRHSIDQGAKGSSSWPPVWHPLWPPEIPRFSRRIHRKTAAGGQGAKLFAKGGQPAARPAASGRDAVPPTIGLLTCQPTAAPLPTFPPLPTSHGQEDQPRGSRSSTRRKPSFPQNSADSLKRIKGIKRINKRPEEPFRPIPNSLSPGSPREWGRGEGGRRVSSAGGPTNGPVPFSFLFFPAGQSPSYASPSLKRNRFLMMRLMTANMTAVDSPNKSRPLIDSSGPSNRHCSDTAMSPYPSEV